MNFHCCFCTPYDITLQVQLLHIVRYHFTCSTFAHSTSLGMLSFCTPCDYHFTCPDYYLKERSVALSRVHINTCVCVCVHACARQKMPGLFEHFAFFIRANECFNFPHEYDASVHIYQNRDSVTCQHTVTFTARHRNLRHHFTDYLNSKS